MTDVAPETVSQLDGTFNPDVLDLSDADTTTFEAIDSGRYEFEVWEGEWTATKENSTGALGPNCPYINLQVRVTENNDKFVNRRLWPKFYPVAPAGYDPAKAARNKGAFVNFLVALGYKEEDVKSPAFKVDFEEMKGKPFLAVVSKDPRKDEEGNIIDYQNSFKGFKPVGDTSVDTPGTGNAVQLL